MVVVRIDVGMSPVRWQQGVDPCQGALVVRAYVCQHIRYPDSPTPPQRTTLNGWRAVERHSDPNPGLGSIAIG